MGAALSLRRLREGAPRPGPVDAAGAAFAALLHIAVPSSLLVVAMTWCVLVPMMNAGADEAKKEVTRRLMYNFTSYCQHGLNAALALGEVALNAVPLEPYLMGFLGLYSSIFGVWAFAFYRATGRWLYPVGVWRGRGVVGLGVRVVGSRAWIGCLPCAALARAGPARPSPPCHSPALPLPFPPSLHRPP